MMSLFLLKFSLFLLGNGRKTFCFFSFSYIFIPMFYTSVLKSQWLRRIKMFINKYLKLTYLKHATAQMERLPVVFHGCNCCNTYLQCINGASWHIGITAARPSENWVRKRLEKLHQPSGTVLRHHPDSLTSHRKKVLVWHSHSFLVLFAAKMSSFGVSVRISGKNSHSDFTPAVLVRQLCVMTISMEH